MVLKQKEIVFRGERVAKHILKGLSIRETAKAISKPKSTVYDDVERIQLFDVTLYQKVKRRLALNKASSRYEKEK